jgi:hypothetical protein
VTISFGPVNCTITTLTDTQYECELETNAVTGNWIVVVNTEHGNLPNSISNEIAVESNLSSISPNTDINFLGGDLLTITGDNFGYDTDAISVVFTDGSLCVVQSADMTTFTCLPDRWEDTKDADKDQTLTVTIHDVEDTS